MRYGVTARRKRNVKRLAGLRELRQNKREQRRAAGDVKMAASEADLSGTLVIEAKRASKSYDGKADRRAISRSAFCAATGSASSARMAPARRRCSIC